MTETQFIEKNKVHWEQLELLLTKEHKDADKLSDLFVKVSSDLAYARTYYPNRSVRLYLNNLTQSVFDSMLTDQDKFSFKQVIDFFKHVLPQEIYNSRKALLTSLFVFLLALAIGVVSSKYHTDFPTMILGEDYIQMTEENIADGDPMAVYKDERKVDMFFGITTNNIRVALLAFVLGILGSVGTIFVLLSNGIMVGAFQYFFFTKGLFWTSFLTIWIHGTIEISAIVLAGGAGIVLGNGLLFPKTYDRGTSMQIAALRALRIILGTVPLFVIAGLLESFVTRQTELPTIVKVAIIAISALLIITMWIIYPWYYHKMGLANDLTYNITPQHNSKRTIAKYQTKSFSKIFSDSFYEFRFYFSKNLGHILLPTLAVLLVAVIVQLKISDADQFTVGIFTSPNMAKLNIGSLGLSIIYLALLSYSACIVSFIINKEDLSLTSKLKFLKTNYIQVFAITAVMYIPYTIIESYNWMFFLLLFSPHFYIIAIEKITTEQNSFWSKFSEAFQLSFTHWIKFLPIYLVALFLSWGYMIIKFASILSVVVEFISWHKIFNNFGKDTAMVEAIVSWSMFMILAPLFYYLFKNQYYSAITKAGSLDLREKLKTFGKSNSVFETI